MLKDDYLQVKLPKELKQAFFEKAEQYAQNPSELVRQWVKIYMEAIQSDRGRDQQQEVVLEVDGKRLGRVMLDSLRSEEQRTGMELVVV